MDQPSLELVACQTATMIMAHVIIDMAVGLARNADDVRIVEAVLETLRDTIANTDTPFTLGSQAMVEADRAKAIALARSQAHAIVEIIETRCRSELAAQFGPAH